MTKNQQEAKFRPTNFIMELRPGKKKINILYKIAAIVIWLVIWQVAAVIIGSKYILVSPVSVCIKFTEEVVRLKFWQAIWGSFWRIALGFTLAALTGAGFAALSYKFRFIREFLSPPMTLLKTVPVASFIVLLLISLSTKSPLSIIICYMMVLPIIYANVLAGLDGIDCKVLEMAKMTKMSRMNRFIYVYMLNVLPHFTTACKVALGLSWKSGIAAELIGIVSGTIGEQLYDAKARLHMDSVFVWTAVIILLSVGFEFLIMSLLKLLKRRLTRD